MDKQHLREWVNESNNCFLVNGSQRKLSVSEDRLKDLENDDFSLDISKYRISKISSDELMLIERFKNIDIIIKRV